MDVSRKGGEVGRELILKRCATVTSSENRKLVEGDTREVSDGHKSSKRATTMGWDRTLVVVNPAKVYVNLGSSDNNLLQNHNSLIDEIHSARIRRLLEVQHLEFTEFCVRRDEEKREIEKEHELNLALIQVAHVDSIARNEKMRYASQEFSRTMDAFNQHMKCQRRILTIMQLDAVKKEMQTKDHFLQEVGHCGSAESFDKIPLPNSGFKLEHYNSIEQDGTHNGSRNSIMLRQKICNEIAIGPVSDKNSDGFPATIPHVRVEDAPIDTRVPVISPNERSHDMPVETTPPTVSIRSEEDVHLETEFPSFVIHRINPMESAVPSVPSCQVSVITSDGVVDKESIENRTRVSQYMIRNSGDKLDDMQINLEGGTTVEIKHHQYAYYNASSNVKIAPGSVEYCGFSETSNGILATRTFERVEDLAMEPKIPATVPNRLTEDMPFETKVTAFIPGGAEVPMEVETPPSQLNSTHLEKSSEPSVSPPEHSAFSPDGVVDDNIKNSGGNMFDNMHIYLGRVAGAEIEHHTDANSSVEIAPVSVECCDLSGTSDGISSAIPNENAEGIPVASEIPTAVPNEEAENVPMETEIADTMPNACLKDITTEIETSASQSSSMIPVKSAVRSGPSPNFSAISQHVAVCMAIEDETTVLQTNVKNSECSGPDEMLIELGRAESAIEHHEDANPSGACLTSSSLQNRILPSLAHSLTSSGCENPVSFSEERSTVSFGAVAGQSCTIHEIVVPAHHAVDMLPSSIEPADHDFVVQDRSQLQCHISTDVEFSEPGQATAAVDVRSGQSNHNRSLSSAPQTAVSVQHSTMPTNLQVEQADRMVSQYSAHPMPAQANLTTEGSHLQYFTRTRVLPESNQSNQHSFSVPNFMPSQVFHTNPFQDVLMRICKQQEIYTQIYETKKEQLNLAYEKEIENIKKKYDEQIQAAVVEFTHDKKMLGMIGNKLNRQKDLAERFRANFFRNREEPQAALRAASRSSMQQHAWMTQAQFAVPPATMPAASVQSLSPSPITLRPATSAAASSSSDPADNEASAALSNNPMRSYAGPLLRAHANLPAHAQAHKAYDFRSQRYMSRSSRMPIHSQPLINSRSSQSMSALRETQPTGGSNLFPSPSTSTLPWDVEENRTTVNL